MTRNVLITSAFFARVLAEHEPTLQQHGFVVRVVTGAERLDESALLAVVPDVEGVICGDDPFTARVMDAAPRLRVISKWGTGVDSIDLHAARARGIRVFNSPGAFTEPVADTAFAFILAFARRVVESDRAVRRGNWPKLQGHALAEATLGIVGFGASGAAVARRGLAFGMRVIACDARPISDKIQEAGAVPATFEDVIAGSDYVSLHCDLNASTRHLINEDILARMRPGAVLINTARGPIIDESALARALESGALRGAGLDVFEIEPLPTDSALRRLDNVLLSPHNANSSPGAYDRVHRESLRNLLVGLGIEKDLGQVVPLA